MRRREDIDANGSLSLCDFCFPRRERSILYENDQVYVMPTIGSFVEGYVLIVSTEHRACIAESGTDGFRRVKNAVGAELDDAYGAHCFFEHGRVGNCYQRAKNRICFHAHLHCLPIGGDIIGTVRDDFPSRRVEGIGDLAAVRQEMPHYLFIEADDGRKRVFEVDGEIERQYLRKRAAELVDLPAEHANWQDCQFPENRRKTAETLSTLPRRIDRWSVRH